MNVIQNLALFIACYFYCVQGQNCNRQACVYYQVISYQLSPLFQNAGTNLFNSCSCQIYGLTIPTVSTAGTSECGKSALTGSATTYLARRPKIVGGLPAQECQYPWQVHVKAGGYNCGGTLIDYQHVITAAHCLQTGNYQIPASSITVGAGSSTKSKLTYYKVTVVSRHPQYYPSTFGSDIAVLKLETKLPETNCTKPACMPSFSLNLSVGTPCLVTGWGALEESGGFPNVLQEAVIPILDSSICVNAYGTSMMDDKKLCAGYSSGGIDACQGDSGGPLMCADGASWVLAGVVSFGLGCARPSYPGVYTHVSNLQNWVETIIN